MPSSRYPGKLRNTPVPAQDRVTNAAQPNLPPGRPDLQEGLITKAWNDYFTAIASQLNATPYQLYGDYQTALTAAITTTDLANGIPINEGIYWLTYYLQVTRAATVSSSLQTTFSWTDASGVAQTETFSALTGNTTGTHQFGHYMIWSVANSPINWAVAYGSVGATAMRYNAVAYLNFWYA